MMIRRVLLVLPLAATLCAAEAPQEISDFREGLDAMSARLWEVAENRFAAVLAAEDLDASGRPTVLLRLAETRLRAGQAVAALATLDDPALVNHPELPFWRAQALAADGRLRDALELLEGSALAPASPHFREARFTRAALMQALGEPDGALEVLAGLITQRDAAAALRARLDSAVILVALGRTDEALKILPSSDARMSPRQSAEADLLRGRAHLGGGDSAAAAALFTALLEREPDPAIKAWQQDAAIGLARAQLADDNRQAATDGLIAFIENNRDSPRVGFAFPALLECLPDHPAADDVILTRLREWCPPPVLRTPPIIASGGGSDGVWPESSPEENELATQALYHLALGLRREGSDASVRQARRLLTRLRLSDPEHPLAERALLESARWDLADGRTEQAAAALSSLDGSDREPALRAEASISAATSAFAVGDFALAAGQLEKAAELLDGDARYDTTLNAAVARLAGGDLPAFDRIAADETIRADLAIDLELERALYLTSQRDASALARLERFIEDRPAHPRLPEARLAAAIASLEGNPSDPVAAAFQLDQLSPGEISRVPVAPLALARIRIAAGEKRWADAAALAKDHLSAHPDDPRRDEFRFELGNARYENGDFNDARLELAALAAESPDSPRAEAALLLAARSSALITTAEAKQESLDLYDQVIARKGPLSETARLFKARSLGPAEAAKELLPWFRQMKKDHPLYRRVGLELGDFLYNSAGTDPAPLTQALGIYDTLLADHPADPAEIQYLRGRVLEQLSDPEDPTKKREGEALDAYFSVLRAAAAEPPTDWRWVDSCGRRARMLLESAHRWDAAIGVAEQHERLASPGAKEAAERARALKLEHFIWDEDDVSGGEKSASE